MNFNNFYSDVFLEKIDNVLKPCYKNGSEYIVLTPKDTECDFAYTRTLTDATVQYKDLGGCNNVPYYLIENLRFVYYSKDCKNENEIVAKFYQNFDLNLMKIKSIKKNKNELLRNECNINNFDVNIKNITYFCIDFELKSKIEINNCQDVCE